MRCWFGMLKNYAHARAFNIQERASDSDEMSESPYVPVTFRLLWATGPAVAAHKATEFRRCDAAAKY